MLRMVVRSLLVLVALMFIAAVSGAYADPVGRGFHQDENLIKAEPVASFHSALHQMPFADFKSNSTGGEDFEGWRIRGIRDGHWLHLSLKDGWNKPHDNDGPSDPPATVATPEPGTLLLMAAGLFIVRRRVLNA